MTFSFNLYKAFIIDHFELFLMGFALLAFSVNHYFSKKVLLIALRKRLFAEQSTRSSHQQPTPAFGGVSIFIVVMITLLLVIGAGFDNAIGFTLASCFLLFLTGFKDDLIGTSAKTKFYVQLIAAFLFVVNPDFALGHLSGFLGVHLIDPNWTYLIGIIFIVSLVNAFNLIDGVDGLSGITAIVSFSVFGIYFYLTNHYIYTIFCVTLIGAIANFLTFNFAKSSGKMFMGDSGALVVGFLLGVFSLRIIELQPIKPFVGFFPRNAVLFVLSVLIIPVLDTARIIAIRLYKGQKPWQADKSHMHHLLLRLGLSHKQVTFCLVTIQIFSITGYCILEKIGNISIHGYIIALYLTVLLAFSLLRK